MSEHRIEAFWSRYARSYDRDGERVVGRPILGAIESNLLAEGFLGDVVEFGCGTGTWTRVIAGHAGYVIATDLSEAMLDVARDQLGGFPNVRVQKADCATASFPRARFDTVLMANLLHVIDDPAPCLQNGYRILREGGVLLAVDLTTYGMKRTQKVRLGWRYLQRWGLPPKEGRNDLSPEDLALLVESVGFKVEEVRLLEAGSNALYLRGGKGLD